MSSNSQLDKGLTEKGVLQLLFDLRFLHDVLAAGRPASLFEDVSGADVEAKTEVAAVRQAFEDLESQLQVRLFLQQMLRGCPARFLAAKSSLMSEVDKDQLFF